MHDVSGRPSLGHPPRTEDKAEERVGGGRHGLPKGICQVEATAVAADLLSIPGTFPFPPQHTKALWGPSSQRSDLLGLGARETRQKEQQANPFAGGQRYQASPVHLIDNHFSSTFAYLQPEVVVLILLVGHQGRDHRPSVHTEKQATASWSTCRSFNSRVSGR